MKKLGRKGEAFMKKGINKIIGVGAVAMFAGALFAQADTLPTRYEIAARLSLPVPPKPIQQAVAPLPEPTRPALDQRLIADLLIESIIQIESAGNPRMVGSRGERGLMQIMPRTWAEVTQRHFGGRIPFSRAFEPDLNRRVGAAYLNDLQDFLARHRHQWKADERALLLACYNAGPDRVRQAGFDLRRLPASTRDYVQRGAALHEALLADNDIPSRDVRLAMDALRRSGGA